MQHDSYRLHFLLHAADLVEDLLRHELAPLGIRPRQARIVQSLAQVGQASQVELARAFHVSPASMSTMTARLVSAGFITRRSDPNESRTNVLGLSDKGRGLLEQIRAAWGRVDATIDAAIGAEDAAALSNLTFRLRNALGGRPPGLQPPDADQPD